MNVGLRAIHAPHLVPERLPDGGCRAVESFGSPIDWHVYRSRSGPLVENDIEVRQIRPAVGGGHHGDANDGVACGGARRRHRVEPPLGLIREVGTFERTRGRRTRLRTCSQKQTPGQGGITHHCGPAAGQHHEHPGVVWRRLPEQDDLALQDRRERPPESIGRGDGDADVASRHLRRHKHRLPIGNEVPAVEPQGTPMRDHSAAQGRRDVVGNLMISLALRPDRRAGFFSR